ncbi:phosphotransferase family protein [Nocardia arthritidis]|uniref:Phosphotransferase n=1 Tax=Nocardia arthritidis TaxID=228602 RepID=A0A6G9YP99_9NOCA|nr:phosphotransferase family protein [Nocardia arthritidis]QIS15022.1 phosphotransferase [Nocardia arthritidis]
MQQVPAFDLETAVPGWLTALGLEHRLPLRATRVGLGQSNLTFAVTDAEERRWILRRPPLGQLLASAHDVAREARILTALADTDVPVPRVHGVVADGEVPVVVMEYVDGLVVDRMDIAEGLTPEHRGAIGISLPRTLARIHAVDLDATGLTGLASHKPYAERQLKRWTAQWEHSRTRELPQLDRLTERLRAAVPPQREIAVVHGDFHIRNVITDPATGAISAVLDWELCTLGDPLADLGSLLAYWPEPGEHNIGNFGMCTLPGFPNRAEIAAEYLAVTGRDIAALGFWHALGLWKVAIIAEGILRRILDDPRNRAASGAPTPERIDEVVAAADKVASAAGI